MDWSKGFMSFFELREVDEDTWFDGDEINMYSCSINKDKDTNLIESAKLYTEKEIESNYVRLYLLASQAGSSEKVALFTGLVNNSSKTFDGRIVNAYYDAYSVLQPASTVLCPRGYYVKRGSGADAVRDMLVMLKCPVRISGQSPVIDSDIVADKKETVLSICQKVLDAIGYRFRLEGDGTVVICPKATEPALSIGDDNDTMETKVTISKNMFDCPNVLMVSTDSQTVVVRNDRQDSPYSTVNRGREVWEMEEGIVLAAGQSIHSYAADRLAELEKPEERIKYTRRYDPDATVGDMISIDYSVIGLSGNYRILSQSINVTYGCSVSEEAVRVE